MKLNFAILLITFIAIGCNKNEEDSQLLSYSESYKSISENELESVFSDLSYVHKQLTLGDNEKFVKRVEQLENKFSGDMEHDDKLVLKLLKIKKIEKAAVKTKKELIERLLYDEKMQLELNNYVLNKTGKKGILGSLGALFGANDCIKSNLNLIDAIGHYTLAVVTAPTGIGAWVNGAAGATSYALAIKQGINCT
jgi:hypothetical protein